jgi:protein involved in sex pheromone biosynthesis
MERAARLIRNTNYSQQILNEDDLTRAVWPVAVGKVIAAHTSRLKLVRTTLIVEVEDAIWQKQLHTLSAQILDRLRKTTGSNTIQEIEFRVAVPRRQPQSAAFRDNTAPQIAASTDEADSIQDPVLKKVYRLSRKKATA